MARQSAGLLLYRWREGALEVLLVHPGGPYWARKDLGAWSIPKGETGREEEPLATALREFHEETGAEASPPFLDLGTIRQPGGKRVHGFAAEGDLDPREAHSNVFEMEWPPRSGRMKRFPEVDRVGWFAIAEAREKINKGQIRLLEALEQCLAQTPPEGT